MKIKIFAVLAALTLLFCAGCSKQTVPDADVEAFLDTGISAAAAYETVAQVEYTVRQTTQNKAGETTGGYNLSVKIDKRDPDALVLEYEQELFGDAVEDGVALKQATITLVDGTYIYRTVVGEEVKEEEAEAQFVTDYITSFFYKNNGAYDEGGLYYGDFFMLYIYKYPESSFSVDKENNLCVFNEKMNISYEETGNVRLHQIAKINVHGLLESNYERYESVDQDYVLVSELTASYIYA